MKRLVELRARRYGRNVAARLRLELAAVGCDVSDLTDGEILDCVAAAREAFRAGLTPDEAGQAILAAARLVDDPEPTGT